MPDQRNRKESTVHLAWDDGGDKLRSLCGLTRPRKVLTEIPEHLCKTCDRIATKQRGDHRHWMWTQQGFKLRWPRIVWTSGTLTCCDLMQSSTGASTLTYWVTKWAS